VRLLLAQFRSPIILLLLVAAMLSFFLDERADAVIIASIILGSGLMSFWQERDAADAMAGLLALIQTTVTVRRDADRRPSRSRQSCPAISSCWPRATPSRATACCWRRRISSSTRRP
jgi:Mg2+-importing ATPase